jgi:hypothetical protein
MPTLWRWSLSISPMPPPWAMIDTFPGFMGTNVKFA